MNTCYKDSFPRHKNKSKNDANQVSKYMVTVNKLEYFGSYKFSFQQKLKRVFYLPSQVFSRGGLLPSECFRLRFLIGEMFLAFNIVIK